MSVWTKIRWLLPRFRELRYRHQLSLFVVLTVPIVGFFWWLHRQAGTVETLSQISATSERVAFDVTQPRLAAFHVRAMRIGTSRGASKNQLNGKCVEGVVTPKMGTSVIYGRVGYGPLSIELLPRPDAVPDSTVAGSFTSVHADNELSLIGRTYLESDETCDHDLSSSSGIARVDPRRKLPLPLPIWGKARIGSEFAGAETAVPEPRVLLDGKLTLSARAVTLFSPNPFMQPTLYQVTELDLPVASRLEAFPSAPLEEHPKGSDENRTQVNWWGIAYIHDERPALSIVVATDVPKLALYRPNRREPDVIEATTLARIWDDPNLIKVYKLLAVIVGSFAVCGWVVRALYFRREEGAFPWEQPLGKP